MMGSGFWVQGLGALLLSAFCLLPAAYSRAENAGVPTAAEAPEKQETAPFTGIDESIVGKYAEKYGRPPREPYININRGDLPLFVFALAGAVGGFILGYSWRKFFSEK